MGVLAVPHKNGNEKRMRRDGLQANEEPHNPALVVKLPGKVTAASARHVEGNDDMLHEVLKHLDAKSLAFASCVNRRWRKASEEQCLWEGICTRNWPATFSPPHQLKSVVSALGGFRRLYALCLHPLLSRPDLSLHRLPFPSSSFSVLGKGSEGRQWSKDEVHLSLSLFSIDCYERLGRRRCNSSSLAFLCKASSSLQMLERISGLSSFGNDREESTKQ